jgi:hypothetical protein
MKGCTTIIAAATAARKLTRRAVSFLAEVDAAMIAVRPSIAPASGAKALESWSVLGFVFNQPNRGCGETSLVVRRATTRKVSPQPRFDSRLVIQALRLSCCRRARHVDRGERSIMRATRVAHLLLAAIHTGVSSRRLVVLTAALACGIAFVPSD